MCWQFQTVTVRSSRWVQSCSALLTKTQILIKHSSFLAQSNTFGVRQPALLYKHSNMSLMYASRWTQVHLLYLLCSLARVLHNPAEKHVRAAIKVFECIWKKIQWGLTLVHQGSVVSSTINHEVSLRCRTTCVGVALTDAALGDDLLKRRSNSAYYVMFCAAVISAR